MVKGHHLQLQAGPLFCHFQLFNVKVTSAHYSVIQKEGQELLAKKAVEPSTAGSGFYSNVFVVPKHVGAL